MFRRRRDAGEGRHQARSAREEQSAREPGRHQRRASGEAVDELAGGWDEQDDQDGQETAGWAAVPGPAGPWDAADSYPQRQRLDVGSLLIPVNPGQDLGLELNDDQSQFIAVSVDIPDGKLQVRAIAAPKNGKLWEDERIGIITEVSRAGGQGRETDGRFGPEVLVHEQP